MNTAPRSPRAVLFRLGGNSLLHEISTQRDAASASLDFETAAALHARLENFNPLLSQLPEIVHRIDRLSALDGATQRQSAIRKLLSCRSARIDGPLVFPIQSAEHTKSQSMESRLQETLECLRTRRTKTALETMEHLALLNAGTIAAIASASLLRRRKGQTPLRRMVRGISRVYRGEKPEPEPIASQEARL